MTTPDLETIGSSTAPDGRRPATDVGIDSRQRILDETIAAIDAGGESSVRLTQVSRRAGVTQGLIAYHFGDREALVSEAQATRFRQSTGQLVGHLETAARDAHSAESLAQVIRSLVESTLMPTTIAERERRLTSLAASLTRTDARDAIGAQLHEFHRAIESVIARGQSIGALDADLDADAAARIISMLCLGGIVVDLDAAHDADGDRAAAVRDQVVRQVCATIGLEIGAPADSRPGSERS